MEELFVINLNMKDFSKTMKKMDLAFFLFLMVKNILVIGKMMKKIIMVYVNTIIELNIKPVRNWKNMKDLEYWLLTMVIDL